MLTLSILLATTMSVAAHAVIHAQATRRLARRTDETRP